jgi:hypothetical protein
MTACNWNAALGIARTMLVVGAAGLLVTACGGGGGIGDDGGGSECAMGSSSSRTSGKSHALAASCNGLPPGFLDGLSIQATSPGDGQAGVPVSVVVRVTFNMSLLTAPSVVVTDQQGHSVAGVVMIDGADVTFTPNSPLSYAVTYSVAVEGGSAEGYADCGVIGPARCNTKFAFTTLASSTAPAIGFASSNLTLPTVAIGGAAAPVRAGIVNLGGGRLTGLSVTDIAYTGTSSGWIKSAVFDASVAPTMLNLAFSTESLDAGDYVATVRISSPVATNHSAAFNVTLKVDVAPGPGPLSPTTALQAKKIAARSINAMFLVDDVVWQAIGSESGWLGSVDRAFGARTLPCAAGTGSEDLIDADASATLTTGDLVEYVFADCRPAADSRWVLNGAPVLTMLPGKDSDAVWHGSAPGTLAFQVADDALRIMPDGWLALSYQWAMKVTWGPVFTTLVDQSVAIPQATLSLGAASVSLTGVAFTSDGISLRALQGVVSTAVEDIGSIRASISTPDGLLLSDEPGTRYRPVGGTVRLASAERTIWVDYGADGGVTLRVDDGNDGTIERTVSTSVAELDSLLSVP